MALIVAGLWLCRRHGAVRRWLGDTVVTIPAWKGTAGYGTAEPGGCTEQEDGCRGYSFAKRRAARPRRGGCRRPTAAPRSCPRRDMARAGTPASPGPQRGAPGSSRALPSPSPPDKGSATDSPREPNGRLLSVGSVLHRATSSPSNTLFAGCRPDAAVSQPDGRPGPDAGGRPPPAWQRPSGKVTRSLVIPVGKNSRGRGLATCAWGGTGAAGWGAKPDPPFLSQKIK